MNKKADITITILVIGIIVVCFLALISFYLASLSTDKNFEGIRKIVRINSNMERYLSGETIKIEEPDASGREYLLDSIKRPTGFLGFGGTKTFFEIKYYLNIRFLTSGSTIFDN